MEGFNILIVEDERNISNVIDAYLKKEKFNTYKAFDGQDALDIFMRENIHLAILDIMLPKISGIDVCRKIRLSSDIPIILLTAKIEEEDKIKGFHLGADDYITKPFSPRELIARVNALLRRAYKDRFNSNLIHLNNIVIDTEKLLIKKDNIPLTLTNNEFKVLLSLVRNPNQPLSRSQLIKLSFGYDYEASDRTIDTYIKNIRHEIEDNPSEPIYIKTVYGVGYKFIKK